MSSCLHWCFLLSIFGIKIIYHGIFIPGLAKISAMSKITFMDLFGAPGGLSLGFKMAGLTPVATLDTFKEGLQTFAANFPEVPSYNIVRADASSPTVLENFRKRTGLKKGHIDVMVGGPPCQGFSVAGRVKIASLVKEGKRNGRSRNARFIDDPRNNLYKTFVKFVKYYKPKAFVMENVQGMMSYRNGWIVEQILEDFRKVGYKNIECRVLNSVDYGTPQRRKRIFFVGSLKKGSEIQWPEKTHFGESALSKTKHKSKLKKHTTVWDAIGDLPQIDIPERGTKLEDTPLPYTKPITEYQKWARIGSNGKVNNHITRWHRPIDLKIFSRMRQGDTWKDIPMMLRRKIGYSNDSFLDKWRKLSWKEPSWTVVAHLHKDGYMYIHPKQLRTISVREAARLQSFPDWFVFSGSRSSQFKQVGNAVPPLMAMAVATQVQKIFH